MATLEKTDNLFPELSAFVREVLDSHGQTERAKKLLIAKQKELKLLDAQNRKLGNPTRYEEAFRKIKTSILKEQKMKINQNPAAALELLNSDKFLLLTSADDWVSIVKNRRVVKDFSGVSFRSKKGYTLGEMYWTEYAGTEREAKKTRMVQMDPKNGVTSSIEDDDIQVCPATFRYFLWSRAGVGRWVTVDLNELKQWVDKDNNIVDGYGEKITKFVDARFPKMELPVKSFLGFMIR